MTILSLAAHAEVDPAPYTLRELRILAEASWWKSSRIEAAIRDFATPRKDKRNWDAKAFNPFARQVSRSITPEDLRALKGLASKTTIVKANEVVVADDT